MNKKFYITTPIYYPSANFHIGHCYTTIAADAIARFKRLLGYDVFFQTGTDEHGAKIAQKAAETGVTPKEYVDKIIENAKDLWQSLDISYDYFIRTTDESHKKSVQAIFKQLYNQGDIYKGKYKGLYCVPCESFWTETQLIDGKCPDCGREVKEVTEEAYFFKLSKYQDKLLDLYEKNSNFILPISRKNELVNNFIKPGLEDLCVSRTSVKWGIPVDFDPKHVIYVWIDALSNYITSLGYPNKDSELFKKYWPADIHLVGKEITRFHAIIWPALLMALGIDTPKQVFGHGWLIINGGKISKSLGNYKDPREYISSYGIDAVRYFVLREVPFGADGTFSEEALINRTNADLVNNLGNLVNRTVSMAHKYFNGKIENKKISENYDNELKEAVNNLDKVLIEKMDGLKINEALDELFEIFRKCNKYIDESTPWVLAKEEDKKDRLETVLYNLLESIRVATIYLQAYLPDTASKIFKTLNTDKKDYNNKSFNEDNSYNLSEATHLFDRIEVK